MDQPNHAYETIEVENGHSALWITLNRPAALNSVTPRMIAEINLALDAAEARPELRAVVLSGRGRAFCSGADLKAGKDGFGSDDPAAAGRRFVRSILALTERIERFPRPVIAAVNGIALAGGFELVLACDVVIAAEEATLGDAHANYGLVPGGGGSARLPRRIGATRAKYLMFSGEFLPAKTFQEWGLVNEVVPAERLREAAERLVARLTTKSPLGLARMKQLVNQSLEQPLAVALEAEQVISELHDHSFDRKEGMAAFTEKRAPNFIGK